MDFLVLALVVFLLYKIVYRFLDNKLARYNQFGLKDADLVYIDDKNTEVLLDHKYKICAKPDFIYEDEQGFILVERKMARRKPTLSDIVQVKASVICARNKYPKLKRAVISTALGNFPVDVKQSSARLFSEIRQHHDVCQAVYQGKVVTETNQSHCKACRTKNNCTRSSYAK
ncbi:hypothetical protein VAS14_00251 [Vibrio angustum S14]|uniref:PD-(D/E)XK endonuclease-like domain-containing protein n=1 Tax=Photobacterium angustum (strain S14 / CCUG 15956) TaxID=314292 RepID=Q1ZJR9_PHOAS|nr:hypothetical protein [Photobacterium angustum]EAS62453.1 hypothetical protein VAS14_00251 [Vibrio angustum S14] [Photobacterium angustum S14]